MSAAATTREGGRAGEKGLKSAALGLVTVAVGFQAPAIMILAFVPMLFVAAGYDYLNRADPDCGTTGRGSGLGSRS